MRSYLQCIVILLGILLVSNSLAADKVAVIPLGSSKGGPGDWKTVSVSSLGGIPRDSAHRTGVSDICGDWGRYANDPYGVDALTVPVQLPDGATIVSFTGLICDTTHVYAGEMVLYRSDSSAVAHIMTGVSETDTATIAVTDTEITPGTEVVDNSKYSYFVYMYINGSAGSALYPVGAIVNLQ